MNDRFQINSALYMYDYRGYQDEVSEFDPDTGARRNIVVNADKARNMGREIEGVWLATDRWTIGGKRSTSGCPPLARC